MNTQRKNIVLYEMIPSLINACKAGLIHSVECSVRAEKEFARQCSMDPEALSLRTLRVRQKTIISLVDEHILSFSTKDAREAAMNIVKATKTIGGKIPQRTSDVLAALYMKKARVDEPTKKFIYGLIDSFYNVSRTNTVVFADKYSGKIYEYKGTADHTIARRVAKAILKIPAVKESLNNISLDDVIFTVHEYASNNEAVPQSSESSFAFGGVSIDLDFIHSQVLFNDIKNRNKTKAAKWLSGSRWKSSLGKKQGRANTYRYLFQSSDDARLALAMVFAMQIASILEMKFIGKINVRSKRDKGVISKYILSPAFNYLDLISPPVDLKRNSASEIFIENMSEDTSYGDRGFILTIDETQDDPSMRKLKFESGQLTMNYRLPIITPSKNEVNAMFKILTSIVRTYSDREHAISHLGEEGNLISLCLSETKLLID